MRTDGCAQVSAPASTRREARLLVPEAALGARATAALGALRDAGDALGRARACRGVLDVLDRLGDVGGDGLHLGHLLLSHVCCEPDLAQRALLGQHILGVEPGGARGEGERSGGWRGRGCAAARARGWARAHICPCKRQAQSLHLPRSAEKRYHNERTCAPRSLTSLFSAASSSCPFPTRAPRACALRAPEALLLTYYYTVAAAGGELRVRVRASCTRVVAESTTAYCLEAYPPK